MLLKPHRISSFGLLPLVFFYLLNRDVKKFFLKRETNTNFLKSHRSPINMVKRTSTCIAVPKKEAQSSVSGFCSEALVIFFSSACGTLIVYLAAAVCLCNCQSSQDQAPRPQNETATHFFHPDNKTLQKP